MGWFTGLRNRRRAENLVESAARAYWSGDLDEASADLTTALSLLRQTGPDLADSDLDDSDLAGSAACLNWLGRIATDQGRFDDADALLRQALRSADGHDETWEKAHALNNLGKLSSARSDLTAAREWYRQALRLLESLGSAEITAVLNNLGSIELAFGDQAAAQSYFDQALASAPEDDHIAIATCLNNLAIIRAEQGDLDEQWRLLTRSLAHCEAGKLVVPGMKVLANMGANLLEAGQPADALGIFEQTLQVAQAVADGSPMVADQHGNLCRALIALGGLDRALEHAQLAVELHEQAHPDSADHGRMLSERAAVHHHRGDLTKALADHRQALRIHEAADGNDIAAAIDLNNIGRVYQDMGDLPRALDYFTRALAIQESFAPASTVTATMHNNIGTVLRAQGDTEAGLTHFQAALEIDRAIAPRSPATATDLSNLGTLHGVAGNLTTAARLHAEALDIDQECAPASPAVAASSANLAAICLRRGELDEAWELARQALELDEALTPGSDRFANDLVLMADIVVARGTPEQAIPLLQRATGIIETLRSQLGTTPNARELALAERYSAYHRLISLLVDNDSAEDSFQQAERAKARVLADMLAESEVTPVPATDEQQALFAEERRLRWRLAAIERTEAQEDRLRTEEELEDVTARLRAASSVYRELRSPDATPLAEIQAALRPDEVMLVFTVSLDGVFVWTLTAHGIEVRVSKATQESLAELVDDAVGSYRRGENGGAQAQAELSKVLIHSLEEAFPAEARRLVVVPDGKLTWLPFELLALRDGTLLGDRFVVSYAPSATVLAHLRRRRANRPPRPANLICFGGALTDHDPIPAVHDELTHAAEPFGDNATVRTGTAATELAVRQEIGGYRYVHFATHGRLNDVRPQFTGLALSPPSAEELAVADDLDDLLQVHEIFDLKLNAELVCCSACDTGRGPVRAGEGVVGLSRALLFAGADCVLLTLWPVLDRPTVRLMAALYRNLAAGMAPAEGLAEAKASVRKSHPRLYRDPRTWAPFVIIGTG